MWYPDDGQAQYEAEMAARASYEAEMEAAEAYAQHEYEMEQERIAEIRLLEAEIASHEHEISKLQERINKLSR